MRPAILAPTYNNACTLPGILDRVATLGLPLIVVDDGSTDATAAVLDRWTTRQAGGAVHVRTHPRNRGKAAALKTGFAAAREAGYTHVVTIDTDGQLSPEEIPALLETARQHPRALVIGVRDEHASGYPRRSRLGRRLSNFMVRVESGVRVADSQCGLRVYPLALVEKATCRAGHFGYETEIITRAGWAGFPVVGTPVSCAYLPPGERVSHFKPWRDTLRGVSMHARLLARALAPWPVTTRPLADGHGDDGATTGAVRRGWREAAAWLSPMRAWRQVREGGVARVDFAAGIAVGVFIANLPVYGLQSILSLYVARRLHLHPLSVLAGSQISSPPVGPVLIAAAIALGHVLLHGSLPTWSHYDPRQMEWTAIVGSALLEWTIGAVIVGGITAAIAFVVADYACRAVRAAPPAESVSPQSAG